MLLTKLDSSIFTDVSIARYKELIQNTEANLLRFTRNTSELQTAFTSQAESLSSSVSIGGSAIPSSPEYHGEMEFFRIENITEMFPIGDNGQEGFFGNFGTKVSKRFTGQPDLESLELDLAYKAKDWNYDSELYSFVRQEIPCITRVTLLSSKPEDYDTNSLKSVANLQFFFVSFLNSIVVTPALKDSVKAKLTIVPISKFMGPFN